LGDSVDIGPACGEPGHIAERKLHLCEEEEKPAIGPKNHSTNREKARNQSILLISFALID
jgi:hypothetical protein